MEKYVIENINYYLFDDIKQSNHLSTFRCKRSHQTYIEKNKIIEGKDFVYARKDLNEWKINLNGPRSKILDKLFIKELWIQEFGKPKKSRENVSSVPDVIGTNEDDWCVDDEGNVYPIEIRGERTPKGCYFRAQDLGVALGINRYTEAIKHNNSAYVENSDYVIFSIKRSAGAKTKPKKEIFLTLDGLIVGISLSRKKKAGAYLFKWISRIFFYGLIGTPEQKTKAISKIVGKSYEDIKKNLNFLTGPVAAIYLIRLSTVGHCRETFGIPESFSDQDIVFKAGKASDLIERLSRHNRGFRDRKITTIYIEASYIVDYISLSDAETAAFEYFGNKGMRLLNKSDKEIVIFPSNKLSNVKKALKRRMERFLPSKDNSTWVTENLRKELVHIQDLRKMENEQHNKELEILRLKLDQANDTIRRQSKKISKLKIN